MEQNSEGLLDFAVIHAITLSRRAFPRPFLSRQTRAIYPTGIGFPVFPATYSDIFYFFLRSLIADKLPEEEK